jgi:uncharacterized protein YggT (Ycf19 family)
MYTVSLIQRLIDFFVSLAVILLGLRVIFRLFDANATGFVEWVYDASGTLMAPFRGIFPSAELDPGNVLDVSALFAILMYVIIGYALSWLVSSLTPRETVVTRKR